MAKERKINLSLMCLLLLGAMFGVCVNCQSADCRSYSSVSWHGETVWLSHGTPASSVSELETLERWYARVKMETVGTTFAAVYGEITPRYMYHFTEWVCAQIGVITNYGRWLGGGIVLDNNYTLRTYMEWKLPDTGYAFGPEIPYDAPIYVVIWRSGISIEGLYWTCRVGNASGILMTTTVLLEQWMPWWMPEARIIRTVAGTEVMELPSTAWCEFDWLYYMCDNMDQGSWQNTPSTVCTVVTYPPYTLNLVTPYYTFVVPSVWNYEIRYHSQRQINGYTAFSCWVQSEKWEMHSNSLKVA